MKNLIHTTCLLLSFAFVASAAQNEYIERYGNAALVPVSIAYPDFHASSPDLVPVKDPVHIVIASDKQIKINAVVELFTSNPRFAYTQNTFFPHKASSQIADQPIGHKNGRLGALNRINNAAKWAQTQNLTDVYICAIENYFESDNENTPRDHAFIMIQSPDGQLFESISDGVAIHKDVFDAAIQNAEQLETGFSKTIGAFLHEQYGFNDSDWFNDVGAGISRVEQIASTLNSESPWF